jgi:hypothetical protein
MTHLLISVLLMVRALLPGGGPPRAAAHDLHVSYGRLAVEGKVAMCQMRFFRHDLEAALQAFHKDPALRMAANARMDSLYARYLGERFRVEAGGRVLRASIVASGEEEDMWWYTVKYEASQPIAALKLTHTMLFDAFHDQRNIVKVKHFPSQSTESLYFARGAEEHALSF